MSPSWRTGRRHAAVLFHFLFRSRLKPGRSAGSEPRIGGRGSDANGQGCSCFCGRLLEGWVHRLSSGSLSGWRHSCSCEHHQRTLAPLPFAHQFGRHCPQLPGLSNQLLKCAQQLLGFSNQLPRRAQQLFEASQLLILCQALWHPPHLLLPLPPHGGARPSRCYSFCSPATVTSPSGQRPWPSSPGNPIRRLDGRNVHLLSPRSEPGQNLHLKARPPPFLGERGKRHLARAVAGPWQ
jgi:hypothetical protein